jgi:HEAT repeat protein
LDEAARRASGKLVRQVDPDAEELTALELRSDVRMARRRGIELAVALGLVNELAEEIGRLLHDDDPYLRLEAVRALSQEDSPTIRRLLRESMLDAHPLVNQAAEEAMLRRTRSVGLAGGTPLTHTNCDTVPGAFLW